MRLTERGKQIRRDAIILSKANGGYHYGGSFSCVEILIALYDYVLKDNDRFILSKGHACWAYYVLLRERGFNPCLEGHPHLDLNNGVHWTTGSEGHGLPAAIGMAMARKIKKQSGKIYVLVGDGECQEGTTWESLLLATRYKLDNLIVIVDKNRIQGSGFVGAILPIFGLHPAAKGCGWESFFTYGHDIQELQRLLKIDRSKPCLMIANTFKGAGISFMEDNPEWHAKWPNEEQERQMFKELA